MKHHRSRTLSAPLACLTAVLLLTLSQIRAVAIPYETEVIAPAGAVYTAEDGSTGVIPYGETVIAEYLDQAETALRIRYHGLRASVPQAALAESAWTHDYCSKLPDPPTVRIMQKDGVPITAHPSFQSEEIGRIPFGVEIVPIYANVGEFYNHLYVDYQGTKGWIYSGPFHSTAEVLTREDAAGTVTIVEDGQRLAEYDAEGAAHPVSAVIPKGTTLPYRYFRDVYYEGGFTAYYLEYQGVTGWLIANSSFMEETHGSYATLDWSGFAMAVDKADCALYDGPFRTGGKTGARIEPGVPVSFDSYAERYIDPGTGKVMTAGKPVLQYPITRLITCRVHVDSAVGWITFINDETGYYRVSKTPRAFTLKEIPVYADRSLQGEPVFTVPKWAFADYYVEAYDEETSMTSCCLRYQGKTGWAENQMIDMDLFAHCSTALSEIPVADAVGSEAVRFTIPAGADFLAYQIPNYRDEADPINRYVYVEYGENAGWIDASADFIDAGEFDAAKQRGPGAALPAEPQTQPATQQAAGSAAQTQSLRRPMIIAAAAGGALLLAGLTAVLLRRRQKRISGGSGAEGDQ